jgi:hypothetical protein
VKLETFLIGSIAVTEIAIVAILAWGILSNREPRP